jgi:hypothetical protein
MLLITPNTAQNKYRAQKAPNKNQEWNSGFEIPIENLSLFHFSDRFFGSPRDDAYRNSGQS